MADQLTLGDDGTLCSCKRCGVTLRFDPFAPRNDVKPIETGVGGAITAFRRAAVPEGLCSTCVVREWFYMMRHTLPVEVKPEHLLLPHIQQQFGEILRVVNADIALGEINWQKLVDEWDLPIPSAGTGFDRKMRKLDEDPLWQKEPPARHLDMRPRRPAATGVGVDDIAQARAAKKRTDLN